MLWQRKDLTSGEDIGAAGRLPAELDGLDEASLVDLSWVDPALGYFGHGFVAVEEPPPPPVVPGAVDLRQAKIKLHREGVLGTIDAMIAGSADPEVVIEWTTAKEVRRDHPFVNGAQLLLGKTTPEMDQWFIEASQIGPMGAA